MATIIPPSHPAPQSPLPGDWSIADLQAHLGGVPVERIRAVPPPGYATVEDVARIAEREDRLFELEDGVLVEKPIGWYESALALLISFEIGKYLEEHDLGTLLGADGSLAILPGVVKIPDVSFIRWENWPREGVSRRPIPSIVPDLVVEVLSETNTAAEMDRKVRRYFEAGVSRIWIVDPATRAAESLTSPDDRVAIPPDGKLEGGAVLPGFEVSLAKLFAEMDRRQSRR